MIWPVCKRENMSRKRLISIVIPVYNGEGNIKPLYDTLLPILNEYQNKYDFELIFTDNHSEDQSISELEYLVGIDKRIKVFRFSRNFGYQKSILTGYLKAQGDAVVQLDCDLQDPPELIIKFFEYWEAGYDVVYGVRRTRQEGILITSARKIFYRLANWLSEDDLPVDAGDFRLIDRKVINVLHLVDDAQPYLRGMISSMGFKQYGIPYDRQERKHGKSHFNFSQLVSLALDGILNHSVLPLRISSYFGIFVSLLTLLAIFGYIVSKIFFGVNWPKGFTTITVLILFGISINAVFLGIIGEYLGRIYQQVKKKPLVIVEKTITRDQS